MCKEAKFIGTFRYDTATNTLIDVCKVELTHDILDAAIREHIFVHATLAAGLAMSMTSSIGFFGC